MRARLPLALPPTRHHLIGSVCLLVVGVLGLSGCSGSSDPAASSGTPSPTVGSTDYLAVPAGVELTPQGSQLGVGDRATVAWQITAKDIAVLSIKVSKLERVPVAQLGAWDLDKQTKRSTPYFVHASVTNVGKSMLKGTAMPLYLVDTKKTYISASTVPGEFKPCPSRPLPAKFKPGATTRTCLLYLAPDGGKLSAVSFYPGPGFVPIKWSGTVTDRKSGKG